MGLKCRNKCTPLDTDGCVILVTTPQKIPPVFCQPLPPSGSGWIVDPERACLEPRFGEYIQPLGAPLVAVRLALSDTA